MLFLDSWGVYATLHKIDFVKYKFGLTSVETLDRMEKELLHLSDELVKVGIKKEDVTGLVKKDLKAVKKAGQAMARLYLVLTLLRKGNGGLGLLTIARLEAEFSCQRGCLEKV